MGQLYGKEIIKKYNILTTTSLKWLSGSYVLIGGKAFHIETDLIMNLTDIDTGSVTANTFYNVFVVNDSNVRKLVYSLDEQPDGFLVGRKLGSMITNASSEIEYISNDAFEFFVPVGTITTFASNNLDGGYLPCDGRVINRSAFSNLFDNIGTLHGQGDGSTTFHLPDYRGRFLRGADEGAGRDTDTRSSSNTGGSTSNVGSVQTDGTAKNGLSASSVSTGAHAHNFYSSDVSTGSGAPNRASHDTNTPTMMHSTSSSGSHSHTITVGNGNVDTRPINAGVKYGIKY